MRGVALPGGVLLVSYVVATTATVPASMSGWWPAPVSVGFGVAAGLLLRLRWCAVFVVAATTWYRHVFLQLPDSSFLVLGVVMEVVLLWAGIAVGATARRGVRHRRVRLLERRRGRVSMLEDS